MNSIKATRARNELRLALREFTEARRYLETVAGELQQDAATNDDARRRAVEHLVQLDRQLRASRERIAALAGVVFENVTASRETSQ